MAEPQGSRGGMRLLASPGGPARAVRPVLRGFVTWRSVLLALALMPVQTYWVMQIELIQYSFTRPTLLSLPLQTLFLMLLLVAANALLRRCRPAWAFSQSELLVVYLMLAISGVVAGYGFVQQLISLVIAPVGWARPENQWEALFSRYLPGAMVVTDAESLRRLSLGGSSFWTRDNLRAWLPVLASWGVFVVAFFTAVMSLNVLLRRRWIEEERLTFPLAQVPLAMTEPAGTLYRSRLM